MDIFYRKTHFSSSIIALLVLARISRIFDLIHVVIPSPEGSSTWTMEELANAMEDSTTKPQHLRAILEAYRRLQYVHESGSTQNAIQVRIPAISISTWTVIDLKEAIGNPETNSQLIPYLKAACNKLKLESDFQNKDRISIVTPVGLVNDSANNI